jgi:hypothetical protein
MHLFFGGLLGYGRVITIYERRFNVQWPELPGEFMDPVEDPVHERQDT